MSPLRVSSAATAAVALALALGLIGAGCGGGEPDPPPPPPDPSAALFDPERIIEVIVTMAPDDWADLRVETRSIDEIFGGDCTAEPFESPFNWYAADVTVDGETAMNVGIRKKGFLGSLNEAKPSLKLKFDAFIPDGELFGLARMTLNNSVQDASFIDQCLGYRVFEEAGLPAPRCNFARVIVNGEDLGLYVHVESVDKRFLRRFFADDSGNLWEGTLSDFRPDWTGTFAKKTNEDDPDRSDLEAVVTAAEASDASLEGALAAVIDLDQFYTFWAVEVLLLHWDGYAGNTNNFHVYGDPSSGVFHFVPWGADQVFAPYGPAAPGELPRSVYATGVLSWRLYQYATTRATYVERLNEVLDTAWDENALLAEIDRMEALILPVADPDGVFGVAASIEETRTYVGMRRGVILAELAGGAPDWPEPLRDPLCFDLAGDVNGTFDTTFGTLGAPNPFAAGTGTFGGTIDGMPLAPTMVGSMAGWDPDAPADPFAMVQVLAALPDGTIDVTVMVVEPSLFFSGSPVVIDWVNALGAVFNFDPATGAAVEVGFMLQGVIQLDMAGTGAGAPVVGAFQADIVRF